MQIRNKHRPSPLQKPRFPAAQDLSLAAMIFLVVLLSKKEQE